MPRRRYRKIRRAEAENATKDAIVRATVELHAEHGVLGTSHAMIAAKAGVSTQTVYNHFPDVGGLVGSCTSHVLARAPALDAECFRAGKTPAERLALLARAAYRQTAYHAPWLRLGWGEAEVVPELAQVFARGQAELRRLLREAVAPEHEASAEFLDSAALLLAYPAWKSLTHGRSRARAAALAGRCIAALLFELCPQRQENEP